MKTISQQFEKYSLFLYRIFWNGSEEIIENGDISESIRIGAIDNYAIITASNPGGKKLSEKQNINLNKKLGAYLVENGIEYFPVQKESIDAKSFIADNKYKTPAFLLQNVSEAKAREIASEFQQLSMVYIEMDPDIHIWLLGIGKYSKERILIFRNKD